jgi:hypothetical protein
MMGNLFLLSSISSIYIPYCFYEEIKYQISLRRNKNNLDRRKENASYLRGKIKMKD